MKKWYLYVVVFISGAAVLAIEILGTRILGPFYGVSIFLWSSLITVTLIALSVGYMLGGRWADKVTKMSNLYYLMFGAGIWLLLIPFIKHPVLIVAEPLGLRFAVLVAAFILFSPSLTLLGMVSPYALKVRTSNLNVVGRTAGDLYAISTIGGVIAALLTGFILIPNIGVGRLTFMVGIVLLFFASIGLVDELKSNFKKLSIVSVFIGTTIGFSLIPFDRPDPDNGLLTIEQSPYAEIRVLDLDNRRYLLIDGGTHTIVDPNTWESYFPYTAVMDLSREFFEQPGEMLLIGLGGGTVMKNFAKASWSVDAVEIDPVVIEIARDYFGLQESEGNIYCMDGRQYLKSNEKKYDVIAMDAFGSSSIPFHLITKESFGLIASRLKPKGIFAINLESNGWDDVIVRSIAATLKEHFEIVLALPTVVPANILGNMILFASNRELELLHDLNIDLKDPNVRLSMDYQRYRAWDYRFIPDLKGVAILTDDLNPVDLWSEKINLSARKGLHDYFKQSGLSW